jgi:hypothetical protein
MNIAEIESELQYLVEKPFDSASFIFRFLEIYDAPKATVTKLKQGSGNHGSKPGDVLWKNKIFFRAADSGKTANAVDIMLTEPVIKKHNPRFIFATDGVDVYCRDRKLDQAIDISRERLTARFARLFDALGNRFRQSRSPAIHVSHGYTPLRLTIFRRSSFRTLPRYDP